MKKIDSLFITFAVALAVLLSFSSLGMAQCLSQDAGGMTHMSWAPIQTAQPLPSTGVTSVFASVDGSFVASAIDATSGEVNYYSLNPCNPSAGWTKVETFAPYPYSNPSFSSSSMPFAFGAKGFNADTISIPDFLYFNTQYGKGYPFYETVVYGGNLIKYTAAPIIADDYYHVAVWPLNGQGGTHIESSDSRFPSFQSPSVFYAFLGDPKNLNEAGHSFYIASALEAKSNQYHSLVISYGFVLHTDPATGKPSGFDLIANLIADPIAPAGETIVGVAASPQWQTSRGYVAVAADGTSYFAQP